MSVEVLEATDFAAMISSGPLRALHEYWTAKCRDGILPRRRDIDPTDLPRILPSIYIVHVLGQDSYQISLFGTGLREMFGFDPTGKDLIEILPAGQHEQARKSYREVIERGMPWLTKALYRLSDGHDVTYERLTLPLSSDGLNVDRFIGAIAWSTDEMLKREYWELYRDFSSCLSRRECVQRGF